MKTHPNEKMKERYYSARSALRQMSLTKAEQKEVMFQIQQVESYGFNFFADHYVIDAIEELEDMAGMSKDNQSSQVA